MVPCRSGLTTDPTGWQPCAPTQNSLEGYNPHPSLHRVREQETSRGKDLLILFLDVAGNLLENLQGEVPAEDKGAEKSPEGGDAGPSGRQHLLVVGLHAEEDEIGRGTGQAALQVGAAPNLLGLRIEAVKGLHSLLKELPLNLERERDRKPGQGHPPWSKQSQVVGGGQW